jgi:hypothetical protein
MEVFILSMKLGENYRAFVAIGPSAKECILPNRNILISNRTIGKSIPAVQAVVLLERRMI